MPTAILRDALYRWCIHYLTSVKCTRKLEGWLGWLILIGFMTKLVKPFKCEGVLTFQGQFLSVIERIYFNWIIRGPTHWLLNLWLLICYALKKWYWNQLIFESLIFLNNRSWRHEVLFIWHTFFTGIYDFIISILITETGSGGSS